VDVKFEQMTDDELEAIANKLQEILDQYEFSNLDNPPAKPMTVNVIKRMIAQTALIKKARASENKADHESNRTL